MGRPKKIVPSEPQEVLEKTITVEVVMPDPTEEPVEEKKGEVKKTLIESNRKFQIYSLEDSKGKTYEIRNNLGQLIGREVDHYTALKTFNRFSR
jgi:hypothetical protein